MTQTERIAKLERDVQELRTQLRERDRGTQTPVTTRPAKVVTAATTGATFGIVFLDVDYEKSINSSVASFMPRQNAQAEFCQNICVDGGNPPVDTRIEVFYWSGRWVTWWRAGNESSSDVSIVKITNSSASSCSPVGQNSSCVWEGKVLSNSLASSQCSDPWVDGIDCWVKAINACPTVTELKVGERFVAKKTGSISISGDSRPLYLIQGHASDSNSTAVVEFHLSGGIDGGEYTVAAGDGLWLGNTLTPDLGVDQSGGGAFTTGSQCYLVPINFTPRISEMRHKERFIGRFAGQATLSGFGTRPCYHVYHDYRELYSASYGSSVLTGASADVELPIGTLDPLANGGAISQNVGDGRLVFNRDGFVVIRYVATALIEATYNLSPPANYEAYFRYAVEINTNEYDFRETSTWMFASGVDRRSPPIVHAGHFLKQVSIGDELRIIIDASAADNATFTATSQTAVISHGIDISYIA